MPTTFAVLELGGTTLKFGLATPAGKLLISHRIPTENRPPDDVIAHAAQFFLGQNYSRVGLAMFGPKSGTTLSPATPKKIWRNVDLLPLLKKHRILKPRQPFVCLHDVQAECLGEAHLGKFPQLSLHLYVTLSTGIGAALYDKSGDYLLHPVEAGHVPVPSRTRGICPSHPHCWEGACSGTALQLTPDGKSHKMPAHWLTNTASALYTLSLTCIPDIIYLGGGVIQAMGHHRDATLRTLRKKLASLNKDYIPLPQLQPATVHERGLAGIALYAASPFANSLTH